jgi:zinc protease
MLRIFSGIMLFGLITGTTAMAQSIFPYQFTREVLPNGLTVYMIPMESPGLVAYYSIVRTGSRDEVERGKSGFAHFFEHMMFRGTKKYPGNVYDSLLTGIGASRNAYTTDDYTAYHLNFASEDLRLVMELESDRFQNLAYGKEAFQTEAGAVYGEYRKAITNPWLLLAEKTQNLAYDVHTYRHTTIGFEADIKAMPQQYEYSLSFFKRFYRPDNTVIMVVGDIDTRTTLEMVTEFYGGWQKGYVAPAIVPEPPQTKERTGSVAYPGKTLPLLNIAYKGERFDPANTRFVAALLLGELAFGETSDLYKKLYIKEQRVQMFGASVPLNRDLPLFEITAMVKKAEDVEPIRDEIYATLAAFRTTPVPEQRLADLKKRQKYAFLTGLDTPDRVAGGLARFVALTGGIEVVEELYRAYERVTPGDVMDAAAAFFTPEQRTVVVLKGAQQ